MKILRNLLCQYKNIYKRKKNTNEKLKKEKKKIVATIASTWPLGTVATVQNLKKKKKNKKMLSSQHFNINLYSAYIFF